MLVLLRFREGIFGVGTAREISQTLLFYAEQLNEVSMKDSEAETEHHIALQYIPSPKIKKAGIH